MSQNEQGMLFSFRLPGGKLRQSAVSLRRQGRTADAITLVRRAAEQEETPSAWLALAEELFRSGNGEAAMPFAARALSRNRQQPGAWMLLARCMQSVGQTETAADCAYHQLHADPWCPDADAARALLDEIESFAGEKEPGRVQMMIQRGVMACFARNRELGERRLRRAIRLAGDKEYPLVTAAMMCVHEFDYVRAMRYLARAQRCGGANLRVLITVAGLAREMNRMRVAHALLMAAAKSDDPALEAEFLRTVGYQNDWTALEAYLTRRMKAQPHRIPLLAARARLADHRGDRETARALRREILAIDPDHHAAALLLTGLSADDAKLINVFQMIPKEIRARELTELKIAAESLPLEAVLRPGSRPRRIIGWMLAEHDPEGCGYILRLLTALQDPVMIPLLKEIACQPGIQPPVRQWALIRLAEFGCRDELLLMTGSSFSVVACQKTDQEGRRTAWRIFLPVLLQETRRHGESPEIAEFAAAVWSCLDEETRLEAARSAFLWAKAVEALYLRVNGREEKAARMITRDAPRGVRKISRILRRIRRAMELELPNE